MWLETRTLAMQYFQCILSFSNLLKSSKNISFHHHFPAVLHIFASVATNLWPLIVWVEKKCSTKSAVHCICISHCGWENNAFACQLNRCKYMVLTDQLSRTNKPRSLFCTGRGKFSSFSIVACETSQTLVIVEHVSNLWSVPLSPCSIMSLQKVRVSPNLQKWESDDAAAVSQSIWIPFESCCDL